MEKKKKRDKSQELSEQIQVDREKIQVDFEEMHNRLRNIEKLYNPQQLNLHFDALQSADAELYKELSILSLEGLEKVRRYGEYFS